MTLEKCYFCKEEKEIGKALFWCPRLWAYHNSKTYYGSWVCLQCCAQSFYKNIQDKHLERSWCGSCAECDFPIGAILEAKRMYGTPSNTDFYLMPFKEQFHMVHGYSSNRLYYGFKWDMHQKKLRLIERPIIDGIMRLVLEHNKLPTKKVILLEDTLYWDPLSWVELNRYYWSSCGSPQHFRKEKWMDKAPVIILSGYLNKEGLNLDEKFKNKIDYLKEQLKGEDK